MDKHEGRGKTGKPFKEGNTTSDGDYIVGKFRPPSNNQFAKGDGRKRGRRKKGTANRATDWQLEAAEYVEITEDGVRKRVTKQRATVKKVVNQAMKGNNRAAEIMFRNLPEPDTARPAQRMSDSELINAWLVERQIRQAGVTDDFDDIGPSSIVAEGEHDQ